MLKGHNWVLHALGYRSGDRAFDSHHDAERSKLPGERLYFDCGGIPRYRLALGTGATLGFDQALNLHGATEAQ